MRKPAAKVLFVEGTNDRSNGDLRQGFNQLLAKRLSGKMPKIIMGNSKAEAIRKFQNNRLPGRPCLLVDLDAPEANIEIDLQSNGLKENEEVVFFMIQEMEAWFLSQPSILDKYYNTEVSKKISKRNPKEITDPANELEKATKDSKKGKYHKIKHGVDLLALLDLDRLEKDFSQVKRLIQTIGS